MKVNVGNIEVEIPGVSDVAATNRAAAEVTRRIAEAEAKSTRIDTLAFALRTAHGLAMDLERVRAERDADAADMAKALQRIAETLKELVEGLQPKS